MAQSSHVPKFGNWDGENVPYTMYFENARKDRGVGTKMINPNDPEQNPEAFKIGTLAPENAMEKNTSNPHVYGGHQSVHAVKHHHGRFSNEDQEGGSRSYSTNAAASKSRRSRSRKNINAESGSEKSNSDHALIHSHLGKSGLRKDSSDISRSTPPPPPAHFKSRSGNTRTGEIPHRVASVPKFGSWDETDPKSGEGFTIIFNNVKEEKQFGAAKLPSLPRQTASCSNAHKDPDNSPESKICCCLFSRRSK